MTGTRKSILDLVGRPEVAHPARILATLERDRVTHLRLPSALLWRLCAEPAARLTDLSDLTEVVHVGPAPLESDVDAAVAVLGPILHHVRAETPDTEEILRRMTEAAETKATGITADHVDEFVAALDEAALSSMLQALRRHDFQLDRVAKRHHTLIRRWMHVLAERGFSQDRVINPAAAWDRAKAAWVPRLGEAEFIDYLRRNAECLDELMSGEQQATLLLFPEGRTDIADAVYRDTITARYLNAAVAEAVRSLAGATPVRILEVGAGTGATTDAVLQTGASIDYLFTDLSNFFLATARNRFPTVRTGLFDIDRTPTAQGYQPQSFDVIIAAGVLNNARDADATVRGLVEMLVPGGWLLITEPTREHYEILTSQAFMMTEAQDARLESGTTFLSPDQWLAILGKAGAEHMLTLPGENHPLLPLGQRLFAARRT